MKRFIGVFIGIGLIVLGILFMTVISKNAADLQKRCTAETTGKVIDTVEKYDTDEGGTTYDTTISSLRLQSQTLHKICSGSIVPVALPLDIIFPGLVRANTIYLNDNRF